MAKRKMSAELKQMLARKRTGPIKPINRYDENGRSCLEFDTWQQAKLWAWANKILAKAGAFAPKEQVEVVLDATMIGTHGLHPTWHGRA